jgi:hypothetical protein
MEPATSSLPAGDVVPIPTLPLVVIIPEVLIAVVPPIVPELIADPDTFPAVEIVANLVSAIAAEAEISASAIELSVISVLPTVDSVARLPRPRLVRPVAATRPVALPSHFKRSV